MLSPMLFALLLFPADQKSDDQELRILFLGNSHTAQNNIPKTVEQLIESDGTGRKVTVAIQSGAFLKSIYNNPSTKDKIKKGDWDYVILQGQEISSSHKYDYSKKEAIALANLAKESGAKPLMFAEWPRRGIDESDYVYNIYDYIVKNSTGKVIPICYAFDAALKQNRSLKLWASDGNHSSQLGGMLASLTIYYWISETKAEPKLTNTRTISASRQLLLRKAAQSTVEKYRKKN